MHDIFSWVIDRDRIEGVVATNAIKTIGIELEAIRILETLVVREEIEIELIIIAAFDLL